MASATKFVDFFVHDILDFSILSKEVDQFTKNITIFNIKEAVAEIIEILRDKTEMIKIDVKTMFEGFETDFIVKTDQKRM